MHTTKILVSGPDDPVLSQLAAYIAGLCDGMTGYNSLPGSTPGEKPFQVEIMKFDAALKTHPPGAPRPPGPVMICIPNVDEARKVLDAWCGTREDSGGGE